MSRSIDRQEDDGLTQVACDHHAPLLDAVDNGAGQWAEEARDRRGEQQRPDGGAGPSVLLNEEHEGQDRDTVPDVGHDPREQESAEGWGVAKRVPRGGFAHPR
jgi:hypothetical protein